VKEEEEATAMSCIIFIMMMFLSHKIYTMMAGLQLTHLGCFSFFTLFAIVILSLIHFPFASRLYFSFVVIVYRVCGSL
jgi:hypothetical protein